MEQRPSPDADTAAFGVPDDLRYSRDDHWLRFEGPLVRIGLTDLAQNALGVVVHLALPAVDSLVVEGSVYGEVESTKTVSGLHAPLSGTVVGTNPALGETPELVNADPYGAGWVLLVHPAGSPSTALMTATAYRALTG